MTRTRLGITSALFVTVLKLSSASAQTALTNAITYQGQLKNSGAPASGIFDMRFSLFNALTAGAQVGSTICLDNVTVTNGLFTVSLDFGAQFDGDQRFLQIAVKPGGGVGDCNVGTYTTLTPRQPLTAAPYALFALASGGPWETIGTNNIHNTNSGNVGIGTTNPLTKLHIAGGQENTALNDGTIFIQSAGGPFGQIMTMDGNEINGWSHLHLNPDANTDILMVEGGGSVGIGTASPTLLLDVNGRIHARQGSDTSAGIYFYQTTPAEDRGFMGMRNDSQIGWYGTQGAGWGMVMDVATGNVGVNTTAPAAQFHVNGTARVNVLEIVGADVAEKFPVSDDVKPGAVVMIDSDHPGKLCLARGAYNRRVAGVVSGANDLHAGTVLGHLPGNEKAPPIALSGRVWVQCDAGQQAIEPGDLLTTAEQAGHAMKAVDLARAQGAMIGKAMTALKQGETGLVLVLVNLQ